MERTPEEIKRGLENCADKSCCEWCPNSHICDLEHDALAYIQQLEQENAQKDERIRQLEREKEALLNIVSRLCIYCKNQGVPKTNEPCYSCVRMGRNNWEWRGVEEEEA